MRSHVAVVVFVLVGLAALGASCGAIRAGNARTNVRNQLGCPDAEVRTVGWSRRLVAEGCGRRGVYYCARQWVACVELAEVVRQRVVSESGCQPASLAVTELELATFMTQGCGGRAVHRCRVGVNGNVQCDIQQPWARTYVPATVTIAPRGAGLDRPAPSAALTPPVQQAAIAPEARAWLDSHRAAILGCAARDTVVVRLERASAGGVDLSLQPPLAGTPEEVCVRTAVGSAPVGVTVSGTVIHAVRPAAASD